MRSNQKFLIHAIAFHTLCLSGCGGVLFALHLWEGFTSLAFGWVLFTINTFIIGLLVQKMIKGDAKNVALYMGLALVKYVILFGGWVIGKKVFLISDGYAVCGMMLSIFVSIYLVHLKLKA